MGFFPFKFALFNCYLSFYYYYFFPSLLKRQLKSVLSTIHRGGECFNNIMTMELVATIPLEGLHGRVFPHVDLQVGTGSKHDFLTSCSVSKALPQGQQETSDGFSKHSVQSPP